MEEIASFIKGAICDDQCLGRCLYIHGVPGTGKTMSVLAVMRNLRSEACNIKPYCFVDINGLKLASPENIYRVRYKTKHLVAFSRGMSESNRSKLTAERHHENYEFLSRCIKDDLGFKDGKPMAACIIYKSLHNWHAFESERTAIFYCIIEGVNDALKVGDENITLPYWLSNSSALLCLLQRNLKSNGFLATTPQRSAGSTGLTGRIGHGLKSSFKYIGFEDGFPHVEVIYEALSGNRVGWKKALQHQQPEPMLRGCRS